MIINMIKFAVIFFTFLWLVGAVSVGLDKAQRFNHRQKEGKL